MSKIYRITEELKLLSNNLHRKIMAKLSSAYKSALKTDTSNGQTKAHPKPHLMFSFSPSRQSESDNKPSQRHLATTYISHHGKEIFIRRADSLGFSAMCNKGSFRFVDVGFGGESGGRSFHAVFVRGRGGSDIGIGSDAGLARLGSWTTDSQLNLDRVFPAVVSSFFSIRLNRVFCSFPITRLVRESGSMLWEMTALLVPADLTEAYSLRAQKLALGTLSLCLSSGSKLPWHWFHS
ncbi:hypothetical protein HYFRA_00004483 [Hymenoscyphus fraxineus]|uniref:Uncharacterized protein n=1 Tax=Hymenoscyphus fraxineus TaxID=746836 RepID=A0A9N9KVJ9_9HELO|nr:hypothetical protein HYFRA_00004483 [Hymenoscyphus fraxineus]